METFSGLNSQHEQIIKRMCGFHVYRFQLKIREQIAAADSIEIVNELRTALTGWLRGFENDLCALPAKGSIHQYISGLKSNQKSVHTTHPHVMVVDGTSFGFLDVPGSPVEAIHVTYENLETLINLIPKLLVELEEREFEFMFGAAAKTPLREIGLLKGIITREQMEMMASTLRKLSGLIDIHQLRKSDAAMVLNTLRERMHFVVSKDLRINYKHASGESEWYGYGEGKAKQKRDLVKNTATSKTYKPSNLIAAWIEEVNKD